MGGSLPSSSPSSSGTSTSSEFFHSTLHSHSPSKLRERDNGFHGEDRFLFHAVADRSGGHPGPQVQMQEQHPQDHHGGGQAHQRGRRDRAGPSGPRGRRHHHRSVGQVRQEGEGQMPRPQVRDWAGAAVRGRGQEHRGEGDRSELAVGRTVGSHRQPPRQDRGHPLLDILQPSAISQAK